MWPPLYECPGIRLGRALRGLSPHLGEILLQELQHVVHGALAVLSGGDTHHSLAVHSHVTRLHTELGHADGIPHRLGVHLQGGRCERRARDMTGMEP